MKNPLSALWASASLLFLCLHLQPLSLQAQELPTPSQQRGFRTPSSYEEMLPFLSRIDSLSHRLEVSIIGHSVEGRAIHAIRFPSKGRTKHALKVLLFARQHGNEPSGTEAVLLLASRLANPDGPGLPADIDLCLIPMLNPDGAEKAQRANTAGADLNRDHLLLSQPETQALHKLFNAQHFDLCLDIHEYWPFGPEWRKAGFRKNSELTLGCLTNPNIHPDILGYSMSRMVPYLLQEIRDAGFSAFHYIPGGPPLEQPLRFSTMDVNDGRQSLGIQGCLSLIQEGMNGLNPYTDSLKRRSEAQLAGLQALLSFAKNNKNEIKSLTKKALRNISQSGKNQRLILQAHHSPAKEGLVMPVLSYSTGRDSSVVLNEFLGRREASLDVERPLAYLVARGDGELISWMERRGIGMREWDRAGVYVLEEYRITGVGRFEFEGDSLVVPEVEARRVGEEAVEGPYYLIPLDQANAQLLVLALEPQSMTGLATYPVFRHMIRPGENWPVIRVLRK